MAKRSNVLTPILMDHLTRLNELEYQSFAHKAMTDKTLQSHQDSLDNRHPTLQLKDNAVFGLSSLLCVRVVTGKPRDIYPVKGFGAVDKQHMDVLAELDRRLQAQLLALAFETMESFYKSFMGKLFYLTRTESSSSIALTHRRNDFRKVLGEKSKIKTGTPQYYEAYAQWYGHRNCDELLKDLCSGCPRFEKLARKNNSGTDFLDFFRTVGLCRHLIVHASGVVSGNAFDKLPKHWTDLIRKKVIRSSKITPHTVLLPDEPFIRWVIARSASFLVLAYEVVSEELGLSVDLDL